MTKKNRLIDSSEAEAHLARAIANDIHNIDMPSIAALEDIAMYITKKHVEDTIIVRLIEKYPELESIDLERYYPKHSRDLTTNFFGRLAYELSAKHTDFATTGTVATPAVVANDIVVLAAAIWISHRLGLETKEVYWLLADHSAVVPDFIRHELLLARWYDPCVGNGVFPLAIISFMIRCGIPIQRETLKKIKGFDIDALAITAAYIRTALLASKSLGMTYSEAYETLPNLYNVEDALNHFTEQDVIDETRSRKPSFADIIIGNPPYVRANRLSETTKDRLKRLYPSVAGGQVDLYNYFIAHGLLAAQDGGVICYISPATFQKSRYGQNTRRFIRQNGSVRVIFDFNELPIFDNAAVHTSVYAIVKGEGQGNFLSYAFDNLDFDRPFGKGMSEAQTMPSSNAGSAGWHTSLPETEVLIELLQQNSLPLKAYAGEILSGIKTGFKDAYFIDRAKAEYLCEDEQSRSFVFPMLRPVTIRTWRSVWDGSHIIIARKGDLVPEKSRVMQHLKVYEAKLRSRTDVRGHPTWYGLRECGYYNLFFQPKIVFPDIAYDCRFSLDTKGNIIPDGAFMIARGDFFLLGLLNSCVGSFYFRARCSSIGNPQDGGRLRFKKSYVEAFPVPCERDEDREIRENIAYLAEELTKHPDSINMKRQIDELVVKLYHLPTEYEVLLTRNQQ
jgi:hypothetical protein